MDDDTLLAQLEEVAQSLQIDVRHEPIKKEGSFFPGGLCKIKNEHVLFINPKATREDKIQIFVNALRRFDLSQVYLKPGLRDVIEDRSE